MRPHRHARLGGEEFREPTNVVRSSAERQRPIAVRGAERIVPVATLAERLLGGYLAHGAGFSCRWPTARLEIVNGIRERSQRVHRGLQCITERSCIYRALVSHVSSIDRRGILAGLPRAAHWRESLRLGIAVIGWLEIYAPSP